MIRAIGLDITEVSRIAAMIERWGDRFTRKVFTDGERAFANDRANPAQHLAARWAAKEATLKALGVPSGLSWHELEVVGGGRQPPVMVLTGAAKKAADAQGIARLHLTLTHAGEMAAAVVVAEQ